MAKELVNTPLYKMEAITLDDTWNARGCHRNHAFLFGEEDTQDQLLSTVDEGQLVEKDIEDPCGNLGTMVSRDEIGIDISKKVVVAPSEGEQPLSVFTDKHAEELAYPTMFCGQPRRSNQFVKVSYGQICKAEMHLNCRRFARHPENLFFKVKKLHLQQCSQKAGVSLRKRKVANATASLIKQSRVEELLQTDKGYSFLSTIRLSPAYYQALKKKCFAFIRQLGKAAFFITLSMPEAQWPDLLKILWRSRYPNSEVPADEDLLKLSNNKKCQLIQGDAAAIVRHFTKKVE